MGSCLQKLAVGSMTSWGVAGVWPGYSFWIMAMGDLCHAAAEQNPDFYFQRLKRRWCSIVRMKGEGKGEILNFTDVSVLQKQSECFKVTKEKKSLLSFWNLLKAFSHLRSSWNSIFKLELLKDLLVKIIVPLTQEEILRIIKWGSIQQRQKRYIHFTSIDFYGIYLKPL